MRDANQADTLCHRLGYEPQELRFGTSGRRGEVIHLTQLEVYINATAELEYLQSLPPSEGGIRKGDEFYLAYDLRPSSSRYVPEQGGRGEIAQAIVRAIRDAEMQPINLGSIPTPALTHYGLSRRKGSIMVTGSHIPFDRNGYKTNTSRGELLKKDEIPINERVGRIRRQIYSHPYANSPFDEQGLFKSGHEELPRETDEAKLDYIRRYTGFFDSRSLDGKQILVYQHSAVGRDILVEIQERLGARIVTCGRSETFVPIDTENVDDAQLVLIQALVEEVTGKQGPPYAVVSTDGDSDRPLVLGVDPATGKVQFFTGDLLGMIVAEYLRADAVVVPISCNDAIDMGSLRGIVEPKTRIGSPYVIAGMEKARDKGKSAVCGWEANGGFLTGSDIVRNGRILKALPTRDAVLPILSVLSAAHEKGCTLAELFAQLPRRLGRSALLKHFLREIGAKLVRRFSPADENIREARFEAERLTLLDEEGNSLPTQEPQIRQMRGIQTELEGLFTPAIGFGKILRLNYTDGVRITFSNGDVAHIRPSGNADELRIYAVADTQERANEIARLGVAEPAGILRRMEKTIGG